MRTTRREALAAAGAAALVATPLARAADPDRERAIRAAAAAVAGEQRAAVAFEAIANSDVLGEENVESMRVLLDHTRAHVRVLEKLFESQTGQDRPRPPTRTQIAGLDSLRSEREALRLALRLEDEAIAAHLDAIRLYRNPAMLRLIAGAMGTDAQHLAMLRALLGDEPVPAPFERGA
jgi:hypothetical protein